MFFPKFLGSWHWGDGMQLYLPKWRQLVQVTRIAKHLYECCLANSKAAHSSHAGLSLQLKVIGNFVSDYLGAIQAYQAKSPSA